MASRPWSAITRLPPWPIGNSASSSTRPTRLPIGRGPLTPDLVAYAAADAAVLVPLHAALQARLHDVRTRGGRGPRVRHGPRAGLARADGRADRRCGVDGACGISACAEQERAGRRRSPSTSQASISTPRASSSLPWQTWAFRSRMRRKARCGRSPTRIRSSGCSWRTKRRPSASAPMAMAILPPSTPTTGRIHADYHQIGAETGRMACARPNLQNIPRDPAYRACIRPAPGRVLVKADLALIELCAAAELAGDERMLEAITTGQDLHRLTAAAIFSKAPEDVTKEERAFGKTVNFGTLYGQGLRGLIEAAQKHGLVALRGRGTTDSATIRRGLARAGRLAARQMRDTAPVIQMPSGRIRRLDPDAPGTVRANTPIQGLAADGFKAALAELWATRHRCPSAAPILAVHDELVIECDVDGCRRRPRPGSRSVWRAGMRRYLTRVPVRVEVTLRATGAERLRSAVPPLLTGASRRRREVIGTEVNHDTIHNQLATGRRSSPLRPHPPLR